MAHHFLAGSILLRDARYNKGTAFSLEERRLLRLEGLLPPHISTQDDQVQRAFEQLDNNCPTDFDKYIFMQGLSNRNQRLFYRVVQERLFDLMPIVYTPTVGKAVRDVYFAAAAAVVVVFYFFVLRDFCCKSILVFS